MRILHLTSQDNGGAGRACVRLHKALLESGVDSIILTQNKTTDTPKTLRLAQTKPQKILEKLRPHLSQIPLILYPKRKKDIFSPNLPFFPLKNRTLLRKIAELKPDIIHLHWIENGFINVADLANLAKLKVPLIWSLHDANPYTGGCHYVAATCIGVGTRCNRCPLLGSNFPFDISFFTFKHKHKAYNNIPNLTINGLSSWIAKCAKESSLFKNKRVINLPNPIDTRVFKPIEKHIARDLLGLDKRHIIAFGAINATSLKRKGFFHLKTALETLPKSLKRKILLVVFGANEGENIEGIEMRFLGHLSDDLSLIILYSAAHIMIVPSLLESFGQTALEALSCGTPVVCFNTSGLKDIVTHKQNGYLAQSFDTRDLGKGIEWILGLDSSDYATLCQNARLSAKERFSTLKIAPKYIEAYKMLIRGGAEQTLAKLLFSALFLSYLGDKRKTLGFGALGGSSVARKGFGELTSALESLKTPLKESLELIVFGSSRSDENNTISGIKTHYLGHLSDDSSLALAYNACDIFIVPSLAENLSNAIMEALSCGVPVLCFDIGGNGDMVSHKSNGYLARDISDLAQGIKWILGLDSSDYAALCQNARKTVLSRFSHTVVTRQYVASYKRLVEANRGGQV